MPCTRPIWGRRCPHTGKVKFNPSLHSIKNEEELCVPCGQCMSCRLEKSRQWAMRCMHEASLHEENCFVTLTYDDHKLPEDYGLVPGHMSQFMKSLRQHIKRDIDDRKIKFFGCGEYGDQTQRPHYHILIFGYDPQDKKLHSRSKNSESLYTSERIESIWQRGYCPLGDISFESAAYVARYQLKKITGLGASYHYQGRHPEFVRMSRGGKNGKGIGHDFLQKWQMDIYPHDYVIVRGKKCKPPKYYDSQLPEEYLEGIKLNRKESAKNNEANYTDYHLNAREVIIAKKQSEIKRDQI